MTNQQAPVALRLAEELEHDPGINRPSVVAELRRLHAENTALQQGYDAARMEIDSLQARVQELGAMLRENRSKRIVELEAQLEAIGAGGVEPLRPRQCLHQISEPGAAAQPPRHVFVTASIGTTQRAFEEGWNACVDAAPAIQAAPADVAGPSDSEIDALVASIGPTEGIRRDSRDLTMDKLRVLVRRALATWGHIKAAPLEQNESAYQRGYMDGMAKGRRDVDAAPQKEAQEPVAWQGVHDQTDLYYTKPAQADVRPLYTTTQPAPAAQGDAEDAARYRWLKSQASEKLLNPRAALSEICVDMRTHWKLPTLICSGPVGGYLDFDASIDAASEQGANHD